MERDSNLDIFKSVGEVELGGGLAGTEQQDPAG